MSFLPLSPWILASLSGCALSVIVALMLAIRMQRLSNKLHTLETHLQQQVQSLQHGSHGVGRRLKKVESALKTKRTAESFANVTESVSTEAAVEVASMAPARTGRSVKTEAEKSLSSWLHHQKIA